MGAPAEASSVGKVSEKALDKAARRKNLEELWASSTGLVDKTTVDDDSDDSLPPIEPPPPPRTQRWRMRHPEAPRKNLEAYTEERTEQMRIMSLSYCPSRYHVAVWVHHLLLVASSCTAAAQLAESLDTRDESAAAQPMLIWAASAVWGWMLIEPLWALVCVGCHAVYVASPLAHLRLAALAGCDLLLHGCKHMRTRLTCANCCSSLESCFIDTEALEPSDDEEQAAEPPLRSRTNP